MPSAHTDKYRKPKIFRGFFNRYQYSKSFFKYLTEDFKHLIRFASYSIYWATQGKKTPHIFVYPHLPSKRSALTLWAQNARYMMSNKPSSSCDLAVFWEYSTLRKEKEDFLKKSPKNPRFGYLNLNSLDIGKTKVDSAFTKVFGYSSQVDPTQHRGPMVIKSTQNATHDGRIVQGPLPTETIENDKIYQILIDNTTSGNQVIDLRTPIVNGSIPFVFIKYRDIDIRFTNDTHRFELTTPSDVFSQEEISLILEFARKLNLDFGELDILRDKKSKKIYIVDVNNTPQSPPAGASRSMKQQVAHLFKKPMPQLDELEPQRLTSEANL